MKVDPIRVDSVVGLAYDRIRALIEQGELTPGGRLGQGELADGLGISRTSVREALTRLTGEGLAVFHANRGFFVAELGLDGVLRRLEVRLLLEPGVARLAAERREETDLGAIRAAIASERGATTREATADASRSFHICLARASRNPELLQVIDSMWGVDVGRRLLAQRGITPSWRGHDVAEHSAIGDAVEAQNGELAAALMTSHVREAIAHWSRMLDASGSDSTPL